MRWSTRSARSKPGPTSPPPPRTNGHWPSRALRAPGTTHVEGVFGEPPDVALDDHQILRGVACSLGIVGTITHPDLVHADMGCFRHVTGLARQQQEHAHRLAISLGHHPGAVALCGMAADADADGGQHVQVVEAAAERNGVVDRSAARIQHDSRATKLAPTREILEIFRTV